MIPLERLATNPVVAAAGWTLLHSLWQCAAVAMVLAGVLLVLRRRTPQARYVASCVALLVMAAAPAVTFFALLQPQCGAAMPVSMPPPAPREALLLRDIAVSPEPWTAVGSVLPLLVVLWIAGVALFAVRALGAWLVVQRTCRGAVAVGSDLASRAREMALALGVRCRIEVRVSHAVSVPSVVGCFRAVILFPAAALAGLPTSQLEAILAHELAHVRRYDYLVNLLQTAVEALLFHHPAVWWVSARIRMEREHCCDDAAVSLTGDLRTYANALVTLEELRASRLAISVAATGGELLPRIRRILGEPTMYAAQHRTAAWLAGALALTLVAAPFAFARDRDDPTPKPPSALPARQDATSPEAPAAAPSADPFVERAQAVLAGQSTNEEIAALKAQIRALERENARLRDSLKSNRNGRPTPEVAPFAYEDRARQKDVARADALRAAIDEKAARMGDDVNVRQANRAKRAADLLSDNIVVRDAQGRIKAEYDRGLIDKLRAENALTPVPVAPAPAAENGAPVLRDVPYVGRLFTKPGDSSGSDILAEIRAMRDENRAMQKQIEELRRQIDALRSRRSSDRATEKPTAALERQRIDVPDQIRKEQLVFTDKHPRLQQLRGELNDLDLEISRLQVTDLMPNPRP